MLVDTNVLLYAVDTTSRFHSAAKDWLETVLTGDRRVALPWESLNAFVRVATHPRASARPLGCDEAWSHVTDWLAVEVVWTPVPTERHEDVLGGLLTSYDVRGPMVSDAHLAALAIQHGLTVCSADTDFARFSEVTWFNPLA
jgi:toxin-antitoxin system PIN domain toxin